MITMKQYLLFIYSKEELGGGWEDFLTDFEDLADCYDEIDHRVSLLCEDNCEEYSWHIVDIESGDIIDRV